MTIDKLTSIIDDCCNDIAFSFNGKKAGIFPEVEDSVKTYHVWYGDKEKDFSDVGEVMNYKFYDGMSLKEIFDKVNDLLIS